MRPDLAPPDPSATEASTQTLRFHGTRFSLPEFEAQLRAHARWSGIPYDATISGGLLWREVMVIVTARPGQVGELVTYARSISHGPSGGAGGGVG